MGLSYLEGKKTSKSRHNKIFCKDYLLLLSCPACELSIGIILLLWETSAGVQNSSHILMLVYLGINVTNW